MAAWGKMLTFQFSLRSLFNFLLQFVGLGCHLRLVPHWNVVVFGGFS